MTKNIFRMGTILALSLAASQTFLSAQDTNSLEGVWDVSVTVTNCQGVTVRTVRSLQLFHRDGSFIETTNLASRGISEGVWKPAGDRTYDASYWFFRYPPPEGPFASFATVKDTITLDADDNHFTASGTVEDFEANGTTMTSCFTHTANRLSAPGQDH
jgi:hypothetical protein